MQHQPHIKVFVSVSDPKILLMVKEAVRTAELEVTYGSDIQDAKNEFNVLVTDIPVSYILVKPPVVSETMDENKLLYTVRFAENNLVSREGSKNIQIDQTKATPDYIAGVLKGIIHVLDQDLAAIQNIQMQLDLLNKDFNQYTYIVSHDLLGPLRAIGMLTDWTLDELNDRMTDSLSENFRLIRSRIRMLQNIILGLSAHRKLLKEPFVKVPFSSHEAAVRATEIYTQQSGVKIIIGNMPEICYDRNWFAAIISHLTDNAIRFNPDPVKEVTIDAEISGNIIEFKVEDNGPGIKSEYHDLIFGLMETLQPKDRSETCGIGLATVKNIVERSNGNIRIDSAPDSGTRFIIRLPDICLPITTNGEYRLSGKSANA
jgi:signal transduction histidine kinase